MHKLALILLFFLMLTACASPYAPLITHSKHAGGYQEELLNPSAADSTIDTSINHKRYLLTYQGTTSDTNHYITHLWNKRANELCPSGYNIEVHRQIIIHGTVRLPVNGLMVTLGTQAPVDKGIIQCQ